MSILFGPTSGPRKWNLPCLVRRVDVDLWYGQQKLHETRQFPNCHIRSAVLPHLISCVRVGAPEREHEFKQAFIHMGSSTYTPTAANIKEQR